MFWTYVIFTCLAAIFYSIFDSLSLRFVDWLGARKAAKFDRHVEQAINLTK